MTETNIQSRAFALFSLAKTLRHYEAVLYQESGEHFNLFNILGVGHYEVRTHSPILAELLNPDGSHGQGTAFLQKFLDILNIQNFDAKSACVVKELPVGELGRLDIVLTDANKQAIFIENKIYAALQDNQLGRYHTSNENATLLFLTLRGENPSDWNTNDNYKKKSFLDVFRPISYEDDIIRWLEVCRKEAATVHGVREVITQYIQLIKQLTHQSTSKRMNQEIINHIIQDKTGATYLAYVSLRNANSEIRKTIISKVNAQLDALGKELGLETLEAFAGEGRKEEQYFYTTPAMRSKNLKFGLRCSSPEYTSFVYGFAYIDGKATDLQNSAVITAFKEVFSPDANSNPFWHVYEYWAQPYNNWDETIRTEIIKNTGLPVLGDLVGKLKKVAYEAATTFLK